MALLSGGAGLRFEDEAEPRVLSPGDYLLIPAHRRHRVEWTDPETPTVWLALHYSEDSGSGQQSAFSQKTLEQFAHEPLAHLINYEKVGDGQATPSL